MKKLASLLTINGLMPTYANLILAKQAVEQGCKSLLSIGGDNLQFYPNFALFSTLRGMNLDHHFFQVSKLSEEQKKGFHQNMEHFSFPEST